MIGWKIQLRTLYQTSTLSFFFRISKYFSAITLVSARVSDGPLIQIDSKILNKLLTFLSDLCIVTSVCLRNWFARPVFFWMPYCKCITTINWNYLISICKEVDWVCALEVKRGLTDNSSGALKILSKCLCTIQQHPLLLTILLSFRILREVVRVIVFNFSPYAEATEHIEQFSVPKSEDIRLSFRWWSATCIPANFR